MLSIGRVGVDARDRIEQIGLVGDDRHRRQREQVLHQLAAVSRIGRDPRVHRIVGRLAPHVVGKPAGCAGWFNTSLGKM